MKKERLIVHVDMDAFFASVEERDNPAYQGKPVVVGADPKKGKGRGVVSTCSYEARKFGIHSAMPISIAYRKCPQAIFLQGNYEKYTRVSGEIISILKNFSPLVEQVSIDEAFLDISATYKLFGTPYEVCVAIKNRIKKETGLACSIGLAPTKMSAKIASGLRKPDGLVEVKAEKLIDFLLPLDVEVLWGIGQKTKTILNQMGIYTIRDLSVRSKEELISLFGKNGAWFWDLSRGIDQSEVISEHTVKSISNEATFEKDIRDKIIIEKELALLCELVSDRLRKEGFKSRTITLKIRLEGFQTYTRAVTLPEPTNFSEDLIREIKRLFENFKTNNKRVRLVGVRASNLSIRDEESLFKDENKEKKEDVHRAIDKIREKFGRSSILRAISV
ncbi:MAG: DNA polymerase IV [Candidatus Omnitrophota bacterium]|nr:DNA polymerase IV [Candidatus Omnitrophota bacterium]